jgi:hypothetical protein
MKVNHGAAKVMKLHVNGQHALQQGAAHSIGREN